MSINVSKSSLADLYANLEVVEGEIDRFDYQIEATLATGDIRAARKLEKKARRRFDRACNIREVIQTRACADIADAKRRLTYIIEQMEIGVPSSEFVLPLAKIIEFNLAKIVRSEMA